MKADNVRSAIMARVMRGISLNRQPGYHFPGNLLDFKTHDGALSVLEPGPHCTDENGEVDIAYFSVFFDVAMGLAARHALDHFGRQATSSISVIFTGRARRGPLSARSQCLGLVEGAARQQVLMKTEVEGVDGIVGYALARFVPMKGHVTVPKLQSNAEPPVLRRDQLDDSEAEIVRRAEEALDRMDRDGGAYPAHFFDLKTSVSDVGAKSTIQNGSHIANRVGHLQGGIQIGLVARTANAALGPNWLLTGANVSYLRPGEGEAFDVVTHIINKGGTTAMSSSQILDDAGRVVLHATTNHTLRTP